MEAMLVLLMMDAEELWMVVRVLMLRLLKLSSFSENQVVPNQTLQQNFSFFGSAFILGRIGRQDFF
jgi:hypothetical protein